MIEILWLAGVVLGMAMWLLGFVAGFVVGRQKGRRESDNIVNARGTLRAPTKEDTMDARGQIGPEKGNYAQDVRRVLDALDRDGHVFVKLADRMTSLHIHLAWRDQLPVLDDGQISGVPEGEGYMLVSRVGHGCYWFQLGTYLAPDYVAEKMDFEYGGDGEILAEFLTRLDAARRGVQA